MSSQLIIHIRQLFNTREQFHLLKGMELSVLPSIENAYLLVKDGKITAYGPMSDLEKGTGMAKDLSISSSFPGLQTIDATGQFVLPAWCDSHTHIVFAGSREAEFVDKLRGLSYAEINARGGGILHSARKLNEMGEEELFGQAWNRLQELSRLGTGAIEIKSGYGLCVEGELKMLRVIKKLKQRSALSIKATFLGAHAYPPEYREDHQGYIDLIIREMLPVIASEQLADYIDVFCEKGFFSATETETICQAGIRYGLRPKLHVNQLNSIGGIQAGIRLNALSLDHLETLCPEEIRLLAESATASGFHAQGVPQEAIACTLLPTAAFFLRMPFQPARELIDAGCAVALASDYNPGSSPSGNMNLVVAMSCIGMRMLPEEAINAATLNGAYAMGLGSETGSITVGKKANLIFTRPIPSLAFLPYAFGTNLIDKVMIGGEFVTTHH